MAQPPSRGMTPSQGEQPDKRGWTPEEELPQPAVAAPEGAVPSLETAPVPQPVPVPETGSDPEAEPGADPGTEVPPQPEGPPLEVPRTRTSATYVALGVGLMLLILILDFIIQNPHDASVHFFTARFQLPVGVLVLAAAVAGGVVVLLVSLARVLQLRLMARRHRRGQPTVHTH